MRVVPLSHIETGLYFRQQAISCLKEKKPVLTETLKMFTFYQLDRIVLLTVTFGFILIFVSNGQLLKCVRQATNSGSEAFNH